MSSLVLVLGGNGYLGSAVTRHFRKRNPSQTVVPMDMSGTEVTLDLRDQNRLFAAVSEAVAQGEWADVSMVNCVSFTVFSPSDERTMAEIVEVVSVNIGISIIAINALADVCARNELPGQVVNVSSIFARNAPRFEIYQALERRSSEVYGASKAGVEQLTRYYAKLLGAQGIRVNCVSPGGILDPHLHSEDFQQLYGEGTALGRMVELHEVVDAVDFLISRRSSAITGAVLPVDCGYGL